MTSVLCITNKKGCDAMQIVTIANQKGGTGKTATAAALAQAAAYSGKRVLAIDLDPQSNLSFALDAQGTGTSYDLIEKKIPARRLIQTAHGIDLIPASWSLATLQSAPGSAKRLATALQPLKGKYDIVIIDTPPTIGELQYNALQASTGLIIPLQAEIYSIKGLYQIIDTAEQFKKSNPALTVKGVLITRYNGRSTLAKQMRQSIEDTAAKLDIPFIGVIREAVSVQEAAALKENLFEYAPNSNPAQDYMRAFESIIS